MGRRNSLNVAVLAGPSAVRSWRIAAGLALVLLAAGRPARADSVWAVPPPGSGDWFAPTNWIGGLPGVGGNAQIDNGGTADIAAAGAACINLYVGMTNGNSGTVRQSDGALGVSGFLYLGYVSGATGNYALSGGDLTAAFSFVGGNGGAGYFTQTGGLHTASTMLALGQDAGAVGNYTLTVGDVAAGGCAIGVNGSGTFTQDGGTNTITNSLELASTATTSVGGYYLNHGTVTSDSTYVGVQGTGTFTQTGGLHQAATAVYVGYLGTGTYTISGGRLSTADLGVGVQGTGTLDIANAAADIAVSGKLDFAKSSVFTAVPGATIHMAGAAFKNERKDATKLPGLANLTLIFEGGALVLDTLEVAGQDKGVDPAGFDVNFAMGTLQVGGAAVGRIQLGDAFDNQPGWAGTEALYVENLIVGPNSYLDLNGVHLYYHSVSIDPTATINGTPTHVPEPATLAMLLLGGAGLIGRRLRPVLIGRFK